MCETLNGFTHDELSSVFAYEPVSGLIVRRIVRGRHAANVRVGTVDGKGYLNVNYKGRFILLHRLAWFLTHKSLPRFIDHMNGDKCDNRIGNLRPCTMSQNMSNVVMYSHNKSGYKGVSQNSKSGKWHAQVKIHGKQTYLGRTDSPHEAALLYNAHAIDVFGEFASFNLLPNEVHTQSPASPDH